MNIIKMILYMMKQLTLTIKDNVLTWQNGKELKSFNNITQYDTKTDTAVYVGRTNDLKRKKEHKKTCIDKNKYAILIC